MHSPKAARLSLMVLVFCLGACATYRSNLGPYRTASDYNRTTERRPSGTLAQEAYRPRKPFHLVWPVAFRKINRGFHPPSDPSHSGLDLAGRRGVPVMAAHEGKVIYRGHDFSGYGNMVIVEYDREWATLYGHLDSFAVSEGEVVSSGQTLGGMGSTGHATGVHLHFEVLHNQQPVDPISLLKHEGLDSALR